MDVARVAGSFWTDRGGCWRSGPLLRWLRHFNFCDLHVGFLPDKRRWASEAVFWSSSYRDILTTLPRSERSRASWRGVRSPPTSWRPSPRHFVEPAFGFVPSGENGANPGLTKRLRGRRSTASIALDVASPLTFSASNCRQREQKVPRGLSPRPLRSSQGRHAFSYPREKMTRELAPERCRRAWAFIDSSITRISQPGGPGSEANRRQSQRRLRPAGRCNVGRRFFIEHERCAPLKDHPFDPAAEAHPGSGWPTDNSNQSVVRPPPQRSLGRCHRLSGRSDPVGVVSHAADGIG